jgi:hypothetical protein
MKYPGCTIIHAEEEKKKLSERSQMIVTVHSNKKK